MHIHIGALDALKAFLGVIILGFFWRLTASYLSDNSIGQAMAFIY
jgi:hypothetical protein